MLESSHSAPSALFAPAGCLDGLAAELHRWGREQETPAGTGVRLGADSPSPLCAGPPPASCSLHGGPLHTARSASAAGKALLPFWGSRGGGRDGTPAPTDTNSKRARLLPLLY